MRKVTMKFGGTSMAALPKVAEILAAAQSRGERLVVVVSALAGVTDGLERSLDAAAAGEDSDQLSECRRLRDQHLTLAETLITDDEARKFLLARLNELCDEHQQICDAVRILGEATPRIRASAMSFGERLSAPILAALLRQMGLRARALATNVDDGEPALVLTDDAYLGANPIWEATAARVREVLLPMLAEGEIPILTGFIGANSLGHTTTLGRGGSDFSAAIFARYCECDELIIWTDVDGVMTVDPSLDERAKVLESATYHEVGQLAYFGARVLHPRTVQPVVEAGIPIQVRNTFFPQGRGTTIRDAVASQPANGDSVLRAVTSIDDVALLTVSGRGMQGVPGIAGRAFLATARSEASILMISQSSSEQNFCFLVSASNGKPVRRAVELELEKEIARGDVAAVALQEAVAIITVVGAGMQDTPGAAGQIFTVLGSADINVISISHGAGECSLSFVVEEGDLARAVRVIHDLVLAVNGREGTRTPDLTDVNRAL